MLITVKFNKHPNFEHSFGYGTIPNQHDGQVTFCSCFSSSFLVDKSVETSARHCGMTAPSLDLDGDADCLGIAEIMTLERTEVDLLVSVLKDV
jgi:hypothetical protein